MDTNASPRSAQTRREAAWVAAIQAGDERAFGEVFDAYYARLCAFAARIVGSMDDAREVVLAVFVRVWERRATWTVRQSLRAYLYGATRNHALNYADRQRRRLAHERTMPDATRPTPVTTHTPEDDLAHTELAEAI